MQPARVLVVDDNALSRRAVGLFLECPRYTTAYAADGEEALSILLRQPFNAVITDVDMPRMDGLELLRYIHDRLPWLPVIVVTGKDSEKVRQVAFACHAIAVFSKPVRRAALLEALALGLGWAAEKSPECRRSDLPAILHPFGKPEKVTDFDSLLPR
ncbi:MAG: response regulator [Rhodocyclaceae bacterium]|nr:response regulator [Rhodocyclaceae bacterium]